MQGGLPSLNLLRAFERAAYHRSFKLAAEDLHLTPSAISHKIRQLEQQLGVPLFQRLTRAIRLTPAGSAYFHHVHRAFARLETGTHQVREQFGQQVLRLHLLPFFASEALIPRLDSFCAQYPDIDLHMESSFRRAQVHPEDADISVALGRGNWPGLVSVELMQIDLMAVCSPQLADQLRPQHYEDINQHTTIHFSFKPDAWEEWSEGVGLAEFKPKNSITVDSMYSGLRAAEQGLGIVPAVLPLCEERLSRSSLVAPFPDQVRAKDRYYMVYRSGDQVRPNVQRFHDWVLQRFGPNA